MTTIESLISFFKKILTSSHQDLETGENWKHRASFLNNQIESNRFVLLSKLIFVRSSCALRIKRSIVFFRLFS